MTAAPRPTTVSLVTLAGCHFCQEAREVLEQLATEDATVRFDVVDATSEAGRELLAAHRPAMNPLVLVDGAYFSAGRLPRRKLQHLLDRRATTGASRG